MIFYFTATGNGKHIAKLVADKTGDNIIDVAECVRGDNFNFKLSEGESLGIVVPVYFYGIPVIIAEFLQRVKISAEGKFYSYAILHCGDKTGNAEKILNKVFNFDAVYALKAVENYVPMYKQPSPAKTLKQLDKTEADALEIAKLINARHMGSFNPVKGKFARILTAFAYPIYIKGRKTKNFILNNGDCTSCGICVKICPRGVIRFVGGKPLWATEQCELCLACLHRCPKSAIDYGKKSAENGRYVNPRVEL